MKNEFIIEYVGEIIRPVLTDKREQYYDSKVGGADQIHPVAPGTHLRVCVVADSSAGYPSCSVAFTASRCPMPYAFSSLPIMVPLAPVLLPQNIGCYMFRIDDKEVVDATMTGNAARFVNHSCDPNCSSRTITVEGLKKIMIVAECEIELGEELTYDYKVQPTRWQKNLTKSHFGTARLRLHLCLRFHFATPSRLPLAGSKCFAVTNQEWCTCLLPHSLPSKMTRSHVIAGPSTAGGR